MHQERTEKLVQGDCTRQEQTTPGRVGGSLHTQADTWTMLPKRTCALTKVVLKVIAPSTLSLFLTRSISIYLLLSLATPVSNTHT